ncbi:hypothetical protein A5906_24565 [Bradyrhizobium sacchari]|uniref:PXPV repeat-containing protein n=1 Tax=Bradyrhizobium sacchari TaxID=1399419 RepID=A0A560K5F7_9BRAD|nr:hypothetical protein [Bradyrhizobium sacchari]OPZ00003.1 hypothetical protein A5906_24565 [Bradyrhizobium sacchari]TWB54074.1 hypothetical protein FBZ94_108362 [Bradyrhizobium sacchari]TWB78522.1 hypothetical protein FBZ95_103362 [Bradyrhizobium sacchari]
MRQMISGLVAAAAVMFVGAAPAAACGFSTCAPVAPVYTGCNTGCGGYGYGYGYGYGAYERLAEPTTQYYYVNQGPTYTGPGAFAPYPTYREDAVVAPANYGYGYGYGYRAAPYHRPYYRPYRYGYGPRYGYLPRTHYGYGPRYGYAHRHAPYYGGHRVLRRYY